MAGVTLHSLPLFVRLTGRTVILIGDGEPAEPKRRLLERAGARIVGEDGTAALAVVAIDDEAEAEAAVARLRARGILVNAVDRPALCDFTIPAIVDRSPVLVAIGTGGASAALAAALRQRLEVVLPPGLGALADALRGARGQLRDRFADGGARRRAIATALGAGGPLDPLADTGATAVSQWLANAAAPAGRLERLRLASRDPDELTLRQARLLALADRIYHAPDAEPAVLARARADAERIPGPAPATLPPGISIEVTMA